MNLLKQYITELFASFNKGSTQNVQPNLLNSDGPVIFQNAGYLGSSSAETITSACVVIRGKNNKFLGVSRKFDQEDFGFPGGHVEPGETPEQAAVRELQAEPGLICTDLQYLVTVPISDRNYCAIYLCKAKGFLHTEETGLIKWVTPQELLQGSFGEQNAIVLQRLGVDLHN